jgi:hypothetical protein
MNDQHIAQLEARLERITEGLFAHLFGRRIQAHDIALQLVRAMENDLKIISDGDSRPVAPDHYTISIQPTILDQINNRYPTLPQVLSQQMIEVAANAGYRIKHAPKIDMQPDPALAPNQVTVNADHIATTGSITDAMQPINVKDANIRPKNPQLIISGNRAITLDKSMMTIGRSRNNNIMLDDPFVSRTHAQIRLRFGHYMIFDTHSQSGTFVNDVRIHEHRLQSGDVVQIGKTTLIYMEDDPDPLTQTGTLHLD